MVPGEHYSSDDEDGESRETMVTQQLQTLQSLIPNMTLSDKRSILETTHDYLRRIHDETEEIEKELILSQQISNINPAEPSSSGHDNSIGASQRPQIIRVEVEEMMERRFVVNISWRRGSGVAGQVQRVIEFLDVKMISITVNESDPCEMLTTALIKVKKGTRMTEEQIHDLVINAARRFSLVP